MFPSRIISSLLIIIIRNPSTQLYPTKSLPKPPELTNHAPHLTELDYLYLGGR